jgi:arginase
MKIEERYAIGYACDLGGAKKGSGDGPSVLQKSTYFQTLKEKGLQLNWQSFIQPENKLNKLPEIVKLCETLADSIDLLVQQKKKFIVFGGDHSSAIGTWSGVANAISQQSLGLIWIDAHLDSHTFQTSQTGNIHGMPLACLLGFGDTTLTHIKNVQPKLRPQNLCVIGARSFEKGEEDLLKSLNVRIFYMNEVKERGIEAVLKEAIERVSQDNQVLGLSLDLDSIDPFDAPGTGVAEPNGISGVELCNALKEIAHHPKFIGAEITEFDPHRDQNQKTEKLIAQLVEAMSL